MSDGPPVLAPYRSRGRGFRGVTTPTTSAAPKLRQLKKALKAAQRALHAVNNVIETLTDEAACDTLSEIQVVCESTIEDLQEQIEDEVDA